jgi:hypothetical protein
MGRGARGERRRYWRELLTQQRRSGMSVADFCRRLRSVGRFFLCLAAAARR